MQITVHHCATYNHIDSSLHIFYHRSPAPGTMKCMGWILHLCCLGSKRTCVLHVFWRSSHKAQLQKAWHVGLSGPSILMPFIVTYSHVDQVHWVPVPHNHVSKICSHTDLDCCGFGIRWVFHLSHSNSNFCKGDSPNSFFSRQKMWMDQLYDEVAYIFGIHKQPI